MYDNLHKRKHALYLTLHHCGTAAARSPHLGQIGTLELDPIGTQQNATKTALVRSELDTTFMHVKVATRTSTYWFCRFGINAMTSICSSQHNTGALVNQCQTMTHPSVHSKPNASTETNVACTLLLHLTAQHSRGSTCKPEDSMGAPLGPLVRPRWASRSSRSSRTIMNRPSSSEPFMSRTAWEACTSTHAQKHTTAAQAAHSLLTNLHHPTPANTTKQSYLTRFVCGIHSFLMKCRFRTDSFSTISANTDWHTCFQLPTLPPP